MNYIEYMQQPAGPITPALQLFNIPNQSAPEEVRQRLGMNSLAYKQLQEKAKQEAIRKYNEERLSRDEIAYTIDSKTGKLQRVYNPGAGYLSGTDPLIKSVVDMTPVGDAEIIAEAGGQAKQGNIGSAAVLAGITLLPNIPGVNSTSKKAVKEGAEKLPPYAKPNYQGDHLELVKNRLVSGGYDRIGNPSQSIDILVNEVPTTTKMSRMSARPGEYYDTAMRPDYTGENAQDFYKQFDIANNIYTAHEFEHYVHLPQNKLPEKVVDPRHIKNGGIRMYFTDNTNSEIAARFGQIKNYFGLKEGELITPEMWEYTKKHYTADTGIDNNMSDFFNLKIDDLQQFLDWGNKNALTLAIPIAAGSVLVSGKNENR